MKKHSNRHTLSSLAPILLFAVFTACVLIVLLTGANIYKNLLSRDQTTFDQRTIVQYLTTKVHQNDRENGISAGNFDIGTSANAGDTLFLCEEIEGRTFCTRIYCHDGYLRELFAEEGLFFSPSDGEKILPATDLAFELENNILHINITFEDQTTESLLFQLRSPKEDSK